MIGRLTGQVLEKHAQGIILLDVGGVGFEVHVLPSSVPTLLEAPAKTTLFIHLIVKEDAITLYGFPTKAHLMVFKLLLQVKNIGPKHAMSILSEMKPEEVGTALQREDSSRFKRVSGIGKKTAEMIIVELRDKIRTMRLAAPSEGPALGGALQEVASALLHLGFRPPDVQKTVEGLRDLEERGVGVEEMIKEALSRLTR
jgi:Holliday junction DNA helicase RuvA